MAKFLSVDYWRAIILYGLNQATYKIALGKTLITFVKEKKAHVQWDDLSAEFLRQYKVRLDINEPMPQQATPSKRTVMERVALKMTAANYSVSEAIDDVGRNAFKDVLPRFHNLGSIDNIQGKFYRFKTDKSLTITDDMFKIVELEGDELMNEVDARWSLLEGAFSIRATDYTLANEILQTYLINGEKRKNITNNIPFLQGYQGNTCFYCSESLLGGPIEVDHVLPRKVVNHDHIWNLVLAHKHCNQLKSDNLVNSYFIEKLIRRNENIIGSSHPWKKKIISQLGFSVRQRRIYLQGEYDQVKIVLGGRYWGGSDAYNPETDPFYRKLITLMNDR